MCWWGWVWWWWLGWIICTACSDDRRFWLLGMRWRYGDGVRLETRLRWTRSSGLFELRPLRTRSAPETSAWRDTQCVSSIKSSSTETPANVRSPFIVLIDIGTHGHRWRSLDSFSHSSFFCTAKSLLNHWFSSNCSISKYQSCAFSRPIKHLFQFDKHTRIKARINFKLSAVFLSLLPFFPNSLWQIRNYCIIDEGNCLISLIWNFWTISIN